MGGGADARCAALTEVIEMKKSTLTPNELAVMMVTELRQFRFDLDDILIVQVESEQVGTNWRVLATIAPDGGCIRNVSAG